MATKDFRVADRDPRAVGRGARDRSAGTASAGLAQTPVAVADPPPVDEPGDKRVTGRRPTPTRVARAYRPR